MAQRILRLPTDLPAFAAEKIILPSLSRGPDSAAKSAINGAWPQSTLPGTFFIRPQAVFDPRFAVFAARHEDYPVYAPDSFISCPLSVVDSFVSGRLYQLSCLPSRVVP